MDDRIPLVPCWIFLNDNDRLLRKAQRADDPARVERGLQAASDLARVSGTPEQALEQARSLLATHGASPTVADPLAKSVELIQPTTGGRAVLDFGLARGLAYYTGLIFDVKDLTHGISLGGGGRYDGLAQALGSIEEVPALGFAYSLETLLNCSSMPELKQPESSTSEPTLVWAGSFKTQREALQLAAEYRGQGTPVEVEISGRKLDQAKSLAGERGYHTLIALDDDGERTTYPLAS